MPTGEKACISRRWLAARKGGIRSMRGMGEIKRLFRVSRR